MINRKAPPRLSRPRPGPPKGHLGSSRITRNPRRVSAQAPGGLGQPTKVVEPGGRPQPGVGQSPQELPARERTEPVAYWDSGCMTFWLESLTPSGLTVFRRANESQLRNDLRCLGFDSGRDEGLPSEIDDLIHQYQKRFVMYSGPLAGWDQGQYEMQGNPILVTSSPLYITPTNGTNTVIKDYIDKLLGEEQATYLHAWLKLGREALHAKNLRRGQVFVIAGERDHGKSLLANEIVVPLLGGRQADPVQGMRNLTTFNKDWFGAEVLVMDDPGSDDRFSVRKGFGDSIKQLVGNQKPRCHGKGQDPIILSPFWRVLVTLNAEPEDLQVLPPMSEGIGDKLILTKTQARAITTTTRSMDAYEGFKQKLTAGLSDYAGWLEQWTIPEELTHCAEAERFGFKFFHHPDIVEALSFFAPETKLLHLIDEGIIELSEGECVKSAREIEQELKLNEITSTEAHRLMSSPGSCGKYLARLVKNHPNRIELGKREPGGGSRLYRLHPQGAETT